MRKWLYRKLARKFISLRKRSEIPISTPEVYHNDDVFVHTFTEEHGNDWLTLIAIDGDHLTFQGWNPEKREHFEEKHHISVLWKNRIEVIHYISRFKVSYDNFPEASLKILTGYYRIWHKRRKKVEEGIKLQNDRMGILGSLLKHYEYDPESSFMIEDVMPFLFGKRIKDADRTDRFWHYTRFLVMSLVESGDLKHDAEKPELAYKFTLTPKSITTLEKFELERRRHTRQVRISQGQMAITFMLLLVALITLLTRLGYFEPKENTANQASHTTPASAPR